MTSSPESGHKSTAVNTDLPADSSSDSEDDDILHYVVFPKISSSPSKEKRKKIALKDEQKFLADKVVVFTEEANRENQKKLEDIEKIANRKANIAAIPISLSSPDSLLWQKITKKGKTMFLPCRECHEDEAFGLNVRQKWNQKEEALVQYFEGCIFAKRSLVKRKMLSPYHCKTLVAFGDELSIDKTVREEQAAHEDNALKNKWCPEKLQLLIERRKRERKMSDIDIRVEQIYLQRILECAIQRYKERKKQEQEELEENEAEYAAAVARGTPCVSQSTDVEEDGQSLDSDSDSSNTSNNGKEKRPKFELIRPDDTIAYYSPIYITGDARGYREAKVLSVDPRRHPVLVLDNGEILPKDVLIKRVEILWRGKYIDYKDRGTFKAMKEYKLKKATQANNKINCVSVGVRKEAERYGKIVEKNMAIFRKRVKESGFGDCIDLMHQYKSRSSRDYKKDKTRNRSFDNVKNIISKNATPCNKKRSPSANSNRQYTKKRKVVEDAQGNHLTKTDGKNMSKKESVTKFSSNLNQNAKDQRIISQQLKMLKTTPRSRRTRSGRMSLSRPTYLNQKQLELALQATEAILSRWKSDENTRSHVIPENALLDLAEKLNISKYQLEKFLEGDNKKLIRTKVHEETELKLRQWLESLQG